MIKPFIKECREEHSTLIQHLMDQLEIVTKVKPNTATGNRRLMTPLSNMMLVFATVALVSLGIGLGKGNCGAVRQFLGRHLLHQVFLNKSVADLYYLVQLD